MTAAGYASWTGPRFTGHLSGFGFGLDEPAKRLLPRQNLKNSDVSQTAYQ
jgi:hypothetical protein